MPHQCTDCGRTFDDGSKEMLSGCPDCGGNKFQFKPAGRDGPRGSEEAERPPEPPEPSVDSSVARTVGNAATAVRDLVSGGPRSSSTGNGGSPSQSPTGNGSPSPTGNGSPSSPAAAEASSRGSDPFRQDSEPSRVSASSGTDAEALPRTGAEDSAQMSARSEVVSPDELPPPPDRFQTVPAFEESGESKTRSRTDQKSRADRKRRADQKTGVAGSERPSERSSASWPDHSDASASESDHSDTASQSDHSDTPTSRPDLSELRAELNDQFESIRVLEPGQYELNLMELFDREEYIIALQEDGKYTIQVPERWRD